MKFNKILLLLIITSFVLKIYSQDIVSGYVMDCKTGEKLIGVSIKDEKSSKSTSSNSFGFYSVTLSNPDSAILEFACIGYQNKRIWIKNINKNLDVKLCEEDYTLNTVEISAYNYSRVSQTDIVSIPMKEIKNLPTIFGETDVLRAYMLMPGVQGGKEGTSELYVRGGSPDQNMVILDDIPLYYLNHMGGFVSIFDNSAIKNVDLYKGGFPARFGGRLSAVTDIRMKDGNKDKFGGEFSLGIISSKIMLEGPVKRDKSSFLVSVRRSIFDIFLRPLSLLASNGETNAGYTFFDINVKFQHKISDKDRLFISAYAGRDRLFMNNNQKDNKYKYKGKDYISWGNVLSSLRWNHQFSQKLFMNVTGAFTNFGYHTDFEYITESLTGGSGSKFVNGYKSVVLDFITKSDFDWYAGNNHKIKFGLQFINHHYKPGVASFKKIYGQSSDLDTTFGSQNLYSYEIDTYIEDEIKLGKRLSTNIGIHHSSFLIEDQWFNSLQPRILALCQISKPVSLKASYTRMTQNIHLLTNSNSSQPTDLWVPATPVLKPENAVQYTFGVSSLFKENILELDIDAFYKEMDNLIEYKEGASFFSNSKDWQDKVEVNGKGLVYGLEFLLRKRSGITTGWIAYTLSKNERNFENLNYGKAFPFKYDRRHDISIVVTHHFSKKVIFSASWTFNTGYHLTLAQAKYDLLIPPLQSNTVIIPPNSIIPPNLISQYAYIYNGKNNYQTNNYHRLDVSCSFIKKLRKGTRTWNISIYNLYCRLNPYYIYYRLENKQLKLYQYSLFPFMPSVSYSYKF